MAAECGNDNYNFNIAYISNSVEALESNGVLSDSYSKVGANIVLGGKAKVDNFRMSAEFVCPTSKAVATLNNPGKMGFNVYNLSAGYQINDKFGIDARYEYAKDKIDGVVQEKTKNITGLLTYSYNDNVSFGFEYLNSVVKNYVAPSKIETDKVTARISYNF